MKQVNKMKILSSLVASILSFLTMDIQADVSANIGFESEYIFRGIAQEKSSAYAVLEGACSAPPASESALGSRSEA